MDDTDGTDAPDGWAVRRRVLGDEYVDARLAEVAEDPVGAEFQTYLTEMAWGVWARGGPLSLRDRSLLVLAMTAAMGRMDEFRIHAAAAPNAGVTDEEVDELVFQVAAYCGGPAGLSARKAVKATRAERDAET
ncbi:MAG: carboxymuconolactone decarboxylase family protein [Acidimicrobiales bacterium]|nr:carboxymuconolactone decarboxylase family protein [Acidimicrobiales bacterium]